jgi:hypothetical protein
MNNNNFINDSDGDGVANSSDVFPNDSSETVDTDGDGVGDNADTDVIVFYQKAQLGSLSSGDIHFSSNGDSIDDASVHENTVRSSILALSGATIHVIGEFPQHAVRKYTNNVNHEKFESTSATSVYYVVENGGVFSGKHYLDEYWGEIHESAYKEVQFEELRLNSANGVSLTIRMPALEVDFDLGVPSESNTINHNFDSDSANASFKDLNLSAEINVGNSYFKADSTQSDFEITDKLFKTYYVPLSEVEASVLDFSNDYDFVGVANSSDAFSNDATESVDTDGDGV